MSRRTDNGISLSQELLTMQSAVRGVIGLSTWAYEQTDDEARRMLPDIIALLEIVNVRVRDLDRVIRGELAPEVYVAPYNQADAAADDDVVLGRTAARHSRGRERKGA